MKTDLKLEILEKLSSLITAGFGLVAALAWNDAIKEFFDIILPQPSIFLGRIIYALVVTILVVIITVNIGRIINRLKIDMQSKEKNGQDLEGRS